MIDEGFSSRLSGDVISHIGHKAVVKMENGKKTECLQDDKRWFWDWIREDCFVVTFNEWEGMKRD